MSDLPTAQSMQKHVFSLVWLGGLLGLLFLALWPISLMIWFLTYFISRFLKNQAALMSKLETIESLLTKEQPEEAEVTLKEAVQES